MIGFLRVAVLSFALLHAARGESLLVYFGTHTAGPGKGFSLARFDTTTGAPSKPEFLLEAPAPAYLIVTPDGKHLYTCNSPGKPVAYGFGWFPDPYARRARMWHSGGTRGFSTVIERFTTEKLTIVALCNRSDLAASQLALRVADVLR